MRNSIKNYSILFLFGLCFLGCKQEVPSEAIESNSFIHTYPMQGSQMATYVHQTDDGGYLIVGHLESSANDFSSCESLVIKTDKFGKIENQQIFKDSMRWPAVIKLRDENYLAVGAWVGSFWKFDKNGNLLFRNYIDKRLSYYSNPFEDENGNLLVSYSRGYFQGTGGYNYLLTYSATGSLLNTRTVLDAQIGYKVCSMNLYDAHDGQNYYFLGDALTNKPWTWDDNLDSYLFKWTIINNKIVSKKVRLLDTTSNNLTTNLRINYANKTSVLLVNKTNQQGTNMSGLLCMVDTNLNVLWKKIIKIDGSSTYVHGLFKTLDGNILACGDYFINNKKQAFATLISSDGVVIWNKIYNTTYSCTINTGEQLADGSFVFVGNTSSFGNGDNEGDIFIIKTDQNGSLK
jgi:hypothetical protein